MLLHKHTIPPRSSSSAGDALLKPCALKNHPSPPSPLTVALSVACTWGTSPFPGSRSCGTPPTFSTPFIANIASATDDCCFRLERVNGWHLVTNLADKALRLAQLPFSHSIITHHTFRCNVSLVAVDETLDPGQQLAATKLPHSKQIRNTSMKSFNDSISVPVIMYKRGDSHCSNYSSHRSIATTSLHCLQTFT